MSLSASVSPRSPMSPMSAMSTLSPRSPISPVSPLARSPVSSYDLVQDIKDDEGMLSILQKIGFTHPQQITDTLQGSIYRAYLPHNGKRGKTVVIKVTDRYLHKHSVSRCIDGGVYKVNEDIVLEQSIVKYLTECDDCPDTFAKFIRFFQTNTDYFYVMEDGGQSMYHFVIKAHRLIKAGKIELSHWKKVVKVIFLQILECIDYLHSKNVVHFDISLENILINDVAIQIQKKKKGEAVRFVLDDIRVKLCDFGMAQLFTHSDCISSMHRGKTNYKSPEVLRKKKGFNAKSNDIWCIGVCIFMASVGFPPFNAAQKGDKAFQYIMKGELLELLKSWKVLRYFDKHLFGLIEAIFKSEEHRMTMNELKNHSYVQSYFLDSSYQHTRHSAFSIDDNTLKKQSH
eukprot:109017_1